MKEKNAIRDYLASIGRKGGSTKSPRKLAAIARNLKKAQAARWPKKDKPQ